MRTDGGAKVSFLFFIDIMMCISGVMLFVIMLLILDLSNGVGLTAGAEKEAKAAVPELHKQIDALQPKLDELKRAVDAPPVPALPVVTFSPEQTAEQEKKLAQLEKQRAEMDVKIADLKKKKETQKPGGDFSIVTFEMPNDDSKRPMVVVECAPDRYTVQAPGGQPHDITSEDLESRLAEVLQLLSAYDAEKISVLVVVKPSEFKNGRIVVSSLRKLKYQTGIEPITETQSAIKR